MDGSRPSRPVEPQPPTAVPSLGVPSTRHDAATGPAASVFTVPTASPASSPTDADVVNRLIDMAADEWNAVADAVERAADAADRPHDGDPFVLAIVAKRPGDGCTTFTRALGEVLRGRGHDVTGRRGIALLDAGAWFGTGAIRRDRAEALADACDAAILLRRADRASAAAFARAIAVAGVTVLGEVATFSRGITDGAEAGES